MIIIIIRNAKLVQTHFEFYYVRNFRWSHIRVFLNTGKLTLCFDSIRIQSSNGSPYPIEVRVENFGAHELNDFYNL